MRFPLRVPLLFGSRVVTDTPADRRWVIPADNRTHTVPAEPRAMTIPADSRTCTVTADRTLLGVS